MSSFTLQFDSRIYRLSAVKKAAYKFTDRCHVQIEATSDQQITVSLNPKKSLENLESLGGDFRNEVLDQELRELIAQETDGLKNLLLAQAFSETSLLDPQGEHVDYRQDPLKIGIADSKRHI